MDNAIQIEHVGKSYKLFKSNKARLLDSIGVKRPGLFEMHHALSDVNFDIKKGETVGIIGTNGAGKSTLLKIITGVITPSEGRLVVDGRISALLELGAGFNMEYTGIENIYLNGTMIGFSREEIDRRMDDILAFADIGDFVHQPVKMYSSGMFVRLAFAVAINIDPEILIVDEALSVGDVFFQAKCYSKFEEFKALGKTILFVSHDLSSIARYCDRVMLLHHGKKLDEGPPKQMIDLYKKVLQETVTRGKGQQNQNAARSADADNWKQYFTVNPELNEYGNGVANIVDYAIVDEHDNLTATIEKGSRFTIKSKVLFHEAVESPIFTFTFKNVKGVDITGSNTRLEEVEIEPARAGDVYVASFTQQMSLQGGEYLLSISCTGYVGGELVVYHRLYDLLNVTVVSTKNTVGFYDMDSETEVVKLA